MRWERGGARWGRPAPGFSAGTIVYDVRFWRRWSEGTLVRFGRQATALGGSPENEWGPFGRFLYGDTMATQVIVLNGGSSSGKSGIVRCLQAVLPEPWLALAIDTFVESMPASMQAALVSPDGGVTVGPEFRKLQDAWREGVAATVRAGARVVIDDVFLGGAHSQEGWRKALVGLDVLWVGVHCEAAVAAGREIARGDRVRGMAEQQAELVHRGVEYDVEVDTTDTESLECARIVAGSVIGGSR